MTLTLVGASNVVSFVATTASTTYSLTTGGKTLPNITINTGSTTTIQFADAVTSTATINLTAGKLDTNGQTVTTAIFQSNTTTARTLTLGASAITCTTNGTAWNTSTVTALTMTANTATATLSGNGSVFSTGAKDYNGLSVVMSGGGLCSVGAGAMTLANFTRTGVSALIVSGSFTVTNTLTLSSASVAGRLLVQSNVIGSSRTITCTGATVVIDNVAAVTGSSVDFMDINIAGSPTWTVNHSTMIGDCGGNSGAVSTNATASSTQTATGTASFSWSTHGWTSRVPLPQDDVVINNAFVSGRTITADMPRLGRSIDFTGCTGSPTLNNTVAITIYGSLTLASGVTQTNANSLSLAGRSSYTVTSAGSTFPYGSIFINAPSGTYTLQDSLISSNLNLSVTVNNGTFIDNGMTVTAGQLVSTGGATRALTLTGTWSLTQTIAPLNITIAGLTLSASTGTFICLTTSVISRSFAGAGGTYGTVTYTLPNSPGGFQITGANTITNLNIGSGRTVLFQSGLTNTITNLAIAGVNNGYVYLSGASGAYISTPDASANQITGDITIDVKVNMTDWTPSGVDSSLVAKYGSGTSISFQFCFTGNNLGKLRLNYSTNGTTSLTVDSTVQTGFVDGTTNWIRVTRIAATGVVKFYTSSDGSSWSQLGTSVTGTSGNLSNQNVLLEIGSRSSGTGTVIQNASIYVVKLYNSDLGSGSGTPVQSFDASAHVAPANTYTSGTGEVWTLNGVAQQGDGRVTVISTNAGTAYTVAVTGGATIPYGEVKDMTATPSKAVYVLDGTNVSGNTGIVFEPQDMSHPSLRNHFFALATAFGSNSAAVRAGTW